MKATTGDLEILSRLKTEPQDPATSAVVFERHYDLLILFLRKRFPKVDADEIYEMAFATLDRLIKMPHRFDPGRSTLEQFLKMDANGDLLNALKKSSNEKNWIKPVEDWEVFRNDLKEETLDYAYEEEALSLFLEKLAEILPDKTDFEIAKMMEQGERDSEKYAILLGITHLPGLEKRIQVKRHKDRIEKKLLRSDWPSFKKSLQKRLT